MRFGWNQIKTKGTESCLQPCEANIALLSKERQQKGQQKKQREIIEDSWLLIEASQ